MLEAKMSKGSTPRPMPNPDKFRDNWDAIFGPKKPNDKDSKPQAFFVLA
jgi:hypothetical protein